MTGSKRRKDKRSRKLTRIVGIASAGLAIAGLIYVLNVGGCI